MQNDNIFTYHNARTISVRSTSIPWSKREISGYFSSTVHIVARWSLCKV